MTRAAGPSYALSAIPFQACFNERVRPRGRGRPRERIAGLTKSRQTIRIVAGCFTLYSKDREKPPFADRAPRLVGQCDASPRDRQLLGCRRAGSQRRAIRTVGTRSR
jgi:hypothetical protein